MVVYPLLSEEIERRYCCTLSIHCLLCNHDLNSGLRRFAYAVLEIHCKLDQECSYKLLVSKVRQILWYMYHLVQVARLCRWASHFISEEER
jgi:hypothetical protein